MNLCLVVDTSITGASLALVQAENLENVIWSHIHPDKHGSSSGLASRLSLGLKESGHQPSDIRQMIISQGPGSFTGIKAGLAFTRGFSSGLKHPPLWMGLSSLEAGGHLLRQKSLKRDETLWFFLPSTKTHGYLAICSEHEVCSFLVDINSMQAGDTDLLLPSEKTHIIFASPWASMEEKYKDHHQVRTLTDNQVLLSTCLNGMIQVAIERGATGFSPKIPEPRYLRKSTVEERMDMIKEKK